MLRLAKLEGCGNDFVVVDLREGGAAHGAHPSPNDAAAAAALCDRRFGVGGDGVLVILPPSLPGALARMRVLNADGSEAEMCGNGIRCVAKYLYERDSRLRLPEIPIETGAGILICGVTVDARRHVTHVSVAMGRPRLERGEIPMDHGPSTERAVDAEINLDGRSFRFTAVSMGNPHAVVFVDGSEPLRTLAERHGKSLELHPWFPRKTNAEFARLRSPTEIELVVWERGCGITLACGTGACATAVAACLTGRARAGSEIAVALLGGTLHITVAADLSGVTMRGPADEVFEGEIELAGLLQRTVRRGAG
ncbi:MAG: diaminopimelate epimerase [Myxococcales bacterium]|nr:diaminopimelate epimerase [Myxococcales bacterium]